MLGVLCASIGSIQVTEAIKLLTGIGEPLVGRLMIYDALEMTYRTIKVRKDPNCAVCGENPTVTELIDYEDVLRRGLGGGRSEAAVGSTITATRAEGHAGRRQATSSWSTSASRPSTRSSRIPGATLIPKGEILSGDALAAAAAGQADRAVLQDRRPLGRGAGRRSRPPASPTRCTSAAASLAWVNQIDPSLPSY